MQRTLFNHNQRFVNNAGIVTPQTREALNSLSRWVPILGTGSPEGEVEAQQYSLYIDKEGTTGAIEYRKMFSDIDGDKKKGWVLV